MSDWSNIALVLVDIQHAFWSPQAKQLFPEVSGQNFLLTNKFLENITNMLRICREARIEVVHIIERFSPSGNDWLPKHLLRGRAIALAGTNPRKPMFNLQEQQMLKFLTVPSLYHLKPFSLKKLTTHFTVLLWRNI